MKKYDYNKTLFLFTSEYPYGNKSETFLETEIKYLSKGFEKVFIIPSRTLESKRDLPENVTVKTSYSNLIFSKKARIIHLIKNPAVLTYAIYTEFKSKGFRKTVKNLKFLLDYFAQNLIRSSLLREDKDLLEPGSLLYDYWYCNFTLSLAILKHKKPSIKFISRTHGYDLYDERWAGSGLPFRVFKLKKMNKLFCISLEGMNYFKSKVSNSLDSKIKLSYLGVKSYPIKFIPQKTEEKLIVSCAALIALKNVAEIVDLIKGSKDIINWKHFGDGPEKEKLLKKVNELPANINFEFKGHVNNTEIIDFYQNNQMDLFISLSESEGLPVSMMEAISFKIPILATNVGGVAEIVIDEVTGFKIENELSNLEKRKLFEKAIHFSFDGDKTRGFYETNFNADRNYTNFIEELKSI